MHDHLNDGAASIVAAIRLAIEETGAPPIDTGQIPAYVAQRMQDWVSHADGCPDCDHKVNSALALIRERERTDLPQRVILRDINGQPGSVTTNI